jgi:parallel beta-helix repeat protein
VAENIILENNVFRKWLRGAVFGDTDGLVLRNNEFVDMRSDGIDFSGVSNVTIEGNYIHGFRQSSGSGDHMDMIQFWTTGVVRPNTNITIRNNWLMAEDGHWAQSIFMRNELVDTGAAGKEMYYRNVTIENNVIHNAHLHGITLGETDGVVIRNNTLLHNTAAGNEGTVNVPRISVAANATNVSVTKNIIPSPRATTEPAGFSDNLYVQQSDPTQPHYYNEYYLNALAQAQVRKHDVTVIPGSLVDRSNYGSALLKPASDFVYFTDRAGTGFNSLMHTFTAAGTNVSAATWNFGDGTTGSGLSATHTYTDAGLYTVTLTATQGSKRVTTKRTIMVQSPIMLRVNFDRDVRDTSPLGHKATITGSPKLENSALTYTTDNTQTVSYTGSKS